MATVAEQLRSAREARKLSINQVAEITKIRTDHVRALEGGDYDMFSAPVYIRGFVRGYATFLKLDVPQMMKTLEAELGQTKQFSAPPPLTKQERGPMDFITLQLSKFNWRKVLTVLGGVAIVVLIIGIATAWARHKRSDPLKDLKPGVYQPAEKNSGQTLTVPAPKPIRR